MRRSTLHRGTEASDDGKNRRPPSRFGSLAQCVLLAVSLLGVGVFLQAVRLGRLSSIELAYASSGAVHAPSTAEAGGRAERQQATSVVQAKAAGGSSAAAPEATPAEPLEPWHRAESSQARAAPAGSPNGLS